RDWSSVVCSSDLAGMYGLSPVVGFMTDRYGHRVTIVIGIVIFLASLIIGAGIPDDTGAIMVSLILLGVAWSFVNVGGSALFAAVVSNQTRASSQGGVDALAS